LNIEVKRRGTGGKAQRGRKAEMKFLGSEKLCAFARVILRNIEEEVEEI
jgi:hypothetical protein